ncbi:MAG: hypothetical protein V4529_16615 [Gemmatimonadota bacterium]
MNEGSTGKLITASIHVATVGLGLTGGFIIADHLLLGWLAIGGSFLCCIATLCRGWVLDEENAELRDALAPTPLRIVGPLPPARTPGRRATVDWGEGRRSLPRIPLPEMDDGATGSWTPPKQAA